MPGVVSYLHSKSSDMRTVKNSTNCGERIKSRISRADFRKPHTALHPRLVRLGKSSSMMRSQSATSICGRPATVRSGDPLPDCARLISAVAASSIKLNNGTQPCHAAMLQAGHCRDLLEGEGPLQNWLLQHKSRGSGREIMAACTGCVPLFNLMEDARRPRLAGRNLAWIHQNAQLQDGRKIDVALCDRIIDEELAKAKQAGMQRGMRLRKIGALMRDLIRSPQFVEF